MRGVLMRLLRLPPHSLGPNPAEIAWNGLREKFSGGLDALEELL
jgi:transposase